MDTHASTPQESPWASLAPQLQSVPVGSYYDFFASAPFGTVVEHWGDFYRRDYRSWIHMEEIEQGLHEDDAEIVRIEPSDLAYRISMLGSRPVRVLILGEKPFQ